MRKQENELVSVIVCVYNIEAYLPRCLETIAFQSYKNIEVVLVDDGSTDGSGKICDEFAAKDDRCVVIHQQNMGLGLARNSGKKAAHGDYLMFLDGDDYFHQDYIAVLYDAINQNGGYDMAVTDFLSTFRSDEDVTAVGESPVTELLEDQLVFSMFKGRRDYLFHYVWNKLYRRTLVDDLWFHDYVRVQDVDFNFRVYLRTRRAVLIDRKLCFYIQRQDSLVRGPKTAHLGYHYMSTIMYQNYLQLSETEKEKFGYLLLEKLYLSMLFWKDRSWKTEREKDAFRQCREYDRTVRQDYWRCPQIGKAKKLTVLFLLYSSLATRCMMKIRKW